MRRNKVALNRFYYESPDGLRYDFYGRIISHSNIGLLPLKFIEDFGPNQNGSTVRDWRINPRTITLEVFLQGDYCCGTRGEQLAELINIIRPNRGTTDDIPGWLRFFNDNGILVEIPVHVLKGPTGDFDYAGGIGNDQVLDAVQFYAADPIWRNYEVNTEIVDFSELESCLPMCLASSLLSTDGACLIASSYANQTFYLDYDGTWDGDQITITIRGPLNNPVITNQTIDKTIELDYNIPTGDYVIITIRPEYVTVLDNNGNNLIGSITSISDLVDFVIKSPGSITPTGENIINVTGLQSSFEDPNPTTIQIDYWTRHISAYGSPECDTMTKLN